VRWGKWARREAPSPQNLNDISLSIVRRRPGEVIMNNNSFGSGPFGGAGGLGGLGFGSGGIWDAMDQLRSAFDIRPNATRVSRGDVRAAVLALLAEEPMHGYQIIREIEERSNGSWKPSAGSVYPTLQLLADEGLISAEEQ